MDKFRDEEVQTTQNVSKHGKFYVYVVVSSANLMMFAAGITLSWTSPVLPQLTNSDDNPLGRRITPGEEAWIAGLLNLGAILGPMAAGPVADKIGRKGALLVTASPIAVSLLITAFATNIYVYYIARLLMGIGAASATTILPIYTGEVADDHNRGTLGCLVSVFLTLGLLFPYVVGPYMTIKNFCFACLLPLLLFLVTYKTLIPETPQYLAYAGAERKLQEVLCKLRNKNFNEVQEMAADLVTSTRGNWSKKKGFRESFVSRGSRRALFVMLSLGSLQQLSGVRVVSSYMQTIFEATASGLAPEINTIIVGIIQVIASVGAFLIVDLWGRRFLMLLSTVSCFISLVSLGIYFYLKSKGIEVDGISWLPLLSLVVYIIAFNVGLGPLPWALLGEIFAPNVKSSASAMVSISCFASAFIVTLCFPYINVLVGMAQSFWIFALVCAFGTVFVYWYFPETKGKNLQEIQEMLQGEPK